VDERALRNVHLGPEKRQRMLRKIGSYFTTTTFRTSQRQSGYKSSLFPLLSSFITARLLAFYQNIERFGSCSSELARSFPKRTGCTAMSESRLSFPTTTLLRKTNRADCDVGTESGLLKRVRRLGDVGRRSVEGTCNVSKRRSIISILQRLEDLVHIFGSSIPQMPCDPKNDEYMQRVDTLKPKHRLRYHMLSSSIFPTAAIFWHLPDVHKALLFSPFSSSSHYRTHPCVLPKTSPRYMHVFLALSRSTKNSPGDNE
jgi:hypothetical protein